MKRIVLKEGQVITLSDGNEVTVIVGGNPYAVTISNDGLNASTHLLSDVEIDLNPSDQSPVEEKPLPNPKSGVTGYLSGDHVLSVLRNSSESERMIEFTSNEQTGGYKSGAFMFSSFFIVNQVERVVGCNKDNLGWVIPTAIMTAGVDIGLISEAMKLDYNFRSRMYCRSALSIAVATTSIKCTINSGVVSPENMCIFNSVLKDLEALQIWVQDQFLKKVSSGETYCYADVVVFAMYVNGKLSGESPTGLAHLLKGFLYDLEFKVKKGGGAFSKLVRGQENKRTYKEIIKCESALNDFTMKFRANHIKPFCENGKSGWRVTFRVNENE